MNKVEWISIKDRLPEEGTYVLISRRIYISDFFNILFTLDIYN